MAKATYKLRSHPASLMPARVTELIAAINLHIPTIGDGKKTLSRTTLALVKDIRLVRKDYKWFMQYEKDLNHRVAVQWKRLYWPVNELFAALREHINPSQEELWDSILDMIRDFGPEEKTIAEYFKDRDMNPEKYE